MFGNPQEMLDYEDDKINQPKTMYSESDLMLAWESGRNGIKLIGTPPFSYTKFKYSTFKEWFIEFKKK
tara:strand:+ start:1112 stop:1315 length:204 start_codon:yes stop_codon:yes gene_type:complete